jgi:hypothetical protein
MRIIASYKAVVANAQQFWVGPWSRTVVIQFDPKRLRQSTVAIGSAPLTLVEQALFCLPLPQEGVGRRLLGQ